MSGPSQVPPPPNPFLLPVLVTVTFLAALVAASGMLSLALDRDVIDYPDAGPLLGVAMALAAGIVTWAGCSRSAHRASPWITATLTALLCFTAVVLAGAVGYALIQGSLSWVVLASAHFAASPFTVAAAVLSGAAVVATWALTRVGRRGASAP